MRARRMGIAVTALGLALVLAGCGGQTGNSAQQQPSPAGSSSAAGPRTSAKQQQPPQAKQAGVQWINGFCQSALKFRNAAQSSPPPKSQDPAAIKQAMSQRLGAMAAAAKTALADLQAMGSSPIKGGDKFVSTAGQMYTQIRSSAQKAKSTVDSAPATDKKAVMQAVRSASKEFRQVNQKKPFQQLQANKQLANSFRQAPQCKQLVQSAQKRQSGAPKKPAPGPGN